MSCSPSVCAACQRPIMSHGPVSLCPECLEAVRICAESDFGDEEPREETSRNDCHDQQEKSPHKASAVFQNGNSPEDQAGEATIVSVKSPGKLIQEKLSAACARGDVMDLVLSPAEVPGSPVRVLSDVASSSSFDESQDTSHSRRASKRPNLVTPLDSQKAIAAAAAALSSFDESQDTSHSSRASKRRKVHQLLSPREETTGRTKNSNHSIEPAPPGHTAVLTSPSPRKLSDQKLTKFFDPKQQEKLPQAQVLVLRPRGPPSSPEQAHSRDDNEDDLHLQRRRSVAPLGVEPALPKESDAIPPDDDDDNVPFWDAALESVPEPSPTTTLWKMKKLALTLLVVVPMAVAVALGADAWVWCHKSLESSRPAWQEFWFIISTVRLVLSGLLGIFGKYLWNGLVSAPVRTTLLVWWIVWMHRRSRAKRQRDLDVVQFA